MRIQFYPQTDELEHCLVQEAKERNITVAELLNSILNARYGIEQGGLSKPEIYEKVDKEVQKFISDPTNFNKEFCLNEASETFRQLEQFYQKPTAIRAVIGRRYAARFGKTEPYLSVHPVLLPNGKQKLNSISRSAVYIIN